MSGSHRYTVNAGMVNAIPNMLLAASSDSMPEYDSDNPTTVPGLGVRDSYGITARAYVIKTYTADDDSAPASLAAAESYDGKEAEGAGIYCDIWIFEPGLQGPHTSVPVMVRNHGAADIEIWRPKPATVKIGGGDLKFDQDDSSIATPVHDTDGDCVLVTFMGNDLSRPVIIGSLPHYSATIVATKDDDPKYKWFRQVHGNKTGIEEGGKLVVDFSEQTDGSKPIKTDGTEEDAENPTMEIIGKDWKATIDKDKMLIDRKDFTMTLNDDGFEWVRGDNKIKVDGSEIKHTVSTVTLTITSSGVDIALGGGNCNITGGAAQGGILMGETADKQGLATQTALLDIGTVISEIMPTIMAAGGLFGTAGGIVNTPQIFPKLISAGSSPAGVPGSSKNLNTAVLVGS